MSQNLKELKIFKARDEDSHVIGYSYGVRLNDCS